MMVWQSFSKPDKQLEIAKYLEALRNRTYVRPGAPKGSGKASAAGKATKPKKVDEYLAVIAQLPLQILILHDGGELTWK